MGWMRLGRQLRAIRLRAIRLRARLTQAEVAAVAHVSRSAVSLLECGAAARLSVATMEAILHAVGARLRLQLLWNGTELDRMPDAGHAALAAAVKERLERWGWVVRVEVSFSRYGERGRIDLLAWHAATGILLVVELKTDLVDLQELLGLLDMKARLARSVAAPFGWPVRSVVPAIVFTEDRTTRRRLASLVPLFSRFDLRGRAAVSWLRAPTGRSTGLLWLTQLSTARVVRIGGQRVRRRRQPSGT